MKKFLSRMQTLRNGESVSAFARKAEIPQPSMDKYLKGRVPSIEVLKQIACRFGVSADWILGLTDDRGGAKATGEGPPGTADDKKIIALEAENAALKGEIRGLRFALDAALKGAQPAPASASRSRPA